MKFGTLRMIISAILVIIAIFLFMLSRFILISEVITESPSIDLGGYLYYLENIFGGNMSDLFAVIFIVLPSLIVALASASHVDSKIRIYSIRLISVIPIVIMAFSIIINQVAFVMAATSPEADFLGYIYTSNIYAYILIALYAGIIVLTSIKTDIEE